MLKIVGKELLPIQETGSETFTPEVGVDCARRHIFQFIKVMKKTFLFCKVEVKAHAN